MFGASFAQARAWRHAGTCTIRHWSTRQKTAGAPRRTAPTQTFTAVPCRWLGSGGGISDRASDGAQEQPTDTLTLLLQPAQVISTGDEIDIGEERYIVIATRPVRPTDVYRHVTLEERR